MLTKEDLLSLAKKVTLVIAGIEDDNSVDREGNKIENKILHLQGKVRASSALPAGEMGLPIVIEDNKVRLNVRDIEEFLKDAKKEGDVIIYDGPLKLDVAKPKLDTNGNVRTPARIWLTSVTFDKLRVQSRNDQTKNFNALISSMFAAGKVVDMSTAANAPVTGGEPPKSEKDDSVDPKAVANRNGAGTGVKEAKEPAKDAK